MKNIVLVISSFNTGGAQRVLSIMANYWVKKDYNITFVTISGGEVFYPLDERINIVSLNLKSESKGIISAIKSNYIRVNELKRTFQEINPDLIISFMITVNMISILAAKLAKKPIIISERNNPWKIEVQRYWKILQKYIFPISNTLVVQTERTKDFYRNYDLPIVTIHNPLDINKMNLNDINIEEREKIILGVGRLVDQKGFDTLIKAFSILENKEEWKLIILGEGKDRNKLERLIKELKIENFVELPGTVKNVDEYMKKSSIFVLSSKYEGFPNVLAEAMAYGMAPISFNCDTGPSEIIINNKNGLLLETNDIDSLTISLQKLINNETLRIKLATNAINISKSLSVSNIMNKWDNLINKILKEINK